MARDKQPKKEIKTVHERDLDRLLVKLKIKEDFDNGKLTCKFCKNIINRENLYSFLSEAGVVHLICDKPDCVSSMLMYVEEKKKKIAEK